MKKVTFVILNILIVVNASAYDTNSYCEKISEVSGGSYQIMETCIEQELKAKNSLY